MRHAALALLAIIILYTLQGCGPDAKPVDHAKEEKRMHDSIENQMVVMPGKKPLRLLTERPYNFETPLKYFLHDLTPNDAFFIRWHLPTPPEAVSEDTFRLRIHGNTSRALALSMNDLRTKFTPYKMVALCQCAGNARSLFKPGVAGAQWVNGGMGNAEWTGVKLKDILAMAGARPGSKFVSFNGLDQPVFPGTPDFVKSLEYIHAIDGEVMVAYEMNGKPLPLLNGYPLKLVVPGWYATYWVKMLSDITVHRDSFKGFWMDKAYLIPRNSPNGNEKPKALAKDMVPINKLDVRSIFVSPDPGTILRPGRTYELQGLAMDDGTGIVKVEISSNKGKSWAEAKLDPSLGKYSWRRWRYNFTPKVAGPVEFVARATNAAGATQPWHHWNRSGYMRNEIESLALTVEKGKDEWAAPAETPQAGDIESVETVLPQAGNVALIEANCVPCHSLRYIEMQPRLSYKAWEKIVNKMITTYGAPIRDSATKQDIINYLHAIKGTREH